MVGIIGKNHEAIVRATNELIHRGPDGFGIYQDMYVSLGHRRLSIIELSEFGQQPMFSANQRYVIVFNGEIYNYKELGEELVNMFGIRLSTNSDTEVLLKMYEHFGEKMLPRLNGIFSFAIWDKLRKELFIAVDSFSVKPLYYLLMHDKLVFGSEIRAIQELDSEANFIDKNQIPNYLRYLWSPSDRTLYKNVKKLKPGYFLRVKDDLSFEYIQWFKLPIFTSKQNLDKKKTIDLVYEKLNKAVSRQMISDVPIGAMLSGGLDSSAIVACAAKVQPKISCLTIEATNTKNTGLLEDLKYAQLVAKHLNVPLSVVQISPKCFSDNLIRVISIMDEPVADPALINILMMSEVARKQGIKVLLSGIGGDEVFGGYRRHLAIKHNQLLNIAPKFSLSIFRKLTAVINNDDDFNRRIQRLVDSSRGASSSILDYITWTQHDKIYALLSSNLKYILDNNHLICPITKFINELPVNASPLEKIMAVDQRFFLTNHNLTYSDKMSMSQGVEIRVPFLDQDLIRLAHSLPDNQKIRLSHGKWALKKAMEFSLPRNLIYRKKVGFGLPLKEWLVDDLSELVNHYLSDFNLKKFDVFDTVAVRELIKHNLKGKDNSYLIFSILCIQIWLSLQSERIATGGSRE